jgi:hypothetical protein
LPIKHKLNTIFFILLVITVFPFTNLIFNDGPKNTPHNELFKSELSNINTIDKASNYIDSVYANDQFRTFDTSVYVQIVSRFAKERFHHGLSHYSLSENWIAYLSGKLFWYHLSAIVNPEDILKHSEGLCSQQTIVFMELLRKKGITVRSIGLGTSEGPGHFLCEVHYGNSWHLHDISVEPVWGNIINHHMSVNYYLSNKDSLYKAYEPRMEKKTFNKIFEKVSFGKANAFPAKNMLLFHRLTYILTLLLPLTCFFVLMFFYIRKLK